MRGIPYASAVESLMFAMLCTRSDICFAVGMVSRYQSEPDEHWIAVIYLSILGEQGIIWWFTKIESGTHWVY